MAAVGSLVAFADSPGPRNRKDDEPMNVTLPSDLVHAIARVPLSDMEKVVKKSRYGLDVDDEVRTLIQKVVGAEGGRVTADSPLPIENRGNASVVACATSPDVSVKVKFGSVAQSISGIVVRDNMTIGDVAESFASSVFGNFVALYEEVLADRPVSQSWTFAALGLLCSPGAPTPSVFARDRPDWTHKVTQSDTLFVSVFAGQSMGMGTPDFWVAQTAAKSIVVMQQAGALHRCGFYFLSVGRDGVDMDRWMPTDDAAQHCSNIAERFSDDLSFEGATLYPKDKGKSVFLLVTFSDDKKHNVMADIIFSGIRRVWTRAALVDRDREPFVSALPGALDALNKSKAFDGDDTSRHLAELIVLLLCFAAPRSLTRTQVETVFGGQFGFLPAGPGRGPWQLVTRLTMDDVDVLRLVDRSEVELRVSAGASRSLHQGRPDAVAHAALGMFRGKADLALEDCVLRGLKDACRVLVLDLGAHPDAAVAALLRSGDIELAIWMVVHGGLTSPHFNVDDVDKHDGHVRSFFGFVTSRGLGSVCMMSEAAVSASAHHYAPNAVTVEGVLRCTTCGHRAVDHT